MIGAGGARRQRIAALALLGAAALAPATPLAGPVRRGDRALLAAVVARRPSSWIGPARRLTRLAAPGVVCAALAATAAFALGRGAPAGAVARPLGGAVAGLLLRRGLAETVRRPRPPAAWWAETPSGFSYPSRHVTWAVLGFGAVRDLLCIGRTAPRGAAAYGMLTGVVTATRLVLAVHWPSDVAAALVLATAWRRLTGPTVARLP